MANDTESTTATTEKIVLSLVPGSRKKHMNIVLVLHMIYILVPQIFITLPLSVLFHHVLNRYNARIVQEIGRPAFSDYVVRLTRTILSQLTYTECRVLFNRTRSYDQIHSSPVFKGFRNWVKFVEVNGIKGRWISRPDSKRSDDEIVLYFIHGGGFIIDSAGSAQIFMLKLIKEMNLKRNIKFSIFCLDYELAPQYKYPSQLIEVSAGYHYLVNTLNISEDRICISGDSAGGNLATAFLLHLARPNPKITVPSSLGATPNRPGSAFLISPFVKLVSHLPSRTENADFDYIETAGSFNAALDYIDSIRPNKKIFLPSWNPLQLFRNPTPVDSVPKNLINMSHTYTGDGEGLELFNSPYVNPSVCQDLSWWKEALPGNGATMVTYGGKEIFRDDVLEFIGVIDAAGVAPSFTKKALGVHDWILYDSFVPGVYKTKSLGPDRNLNYGLESFANFLQEMTSRNKKVQ